MAASPQFPLCLEDICMINVALRLEEFPVQSLLLLPHAIRQRLYRGLSRADRLYYKDTGLFRYGDYDIFRDEELLFDILLTRPNNYRIVSFFSQDVLSCLKTDHDYEESLALKQHITKCYSSLQISSLHYNSFFLPKRFLRNGHFIFKVGLSSLEQLLLHCTFKPRNGTIAIDLTDFTRSIVWEEFYKMFKETGEKQYESNKSVEVQMDPVLIIQPILSTVESIKISAGIFAKGKKSLIAMASYVLLYNIITSEQPHLKSIIVSGKCEYTDHILTGIAKLCCWNENRLPVCSNCKFQLKLATPILPCNFLKELMVQPIKVTNKHAGSICESTRVIISSQLHSLESVSIHGLGFTRDDMCSSKRNNTVPEYRALLCTLNDLLKQPQFVSMTVSRSPLPDVYQLIETILCTEATHHQYLQIAGVTYEEECQWSINDYTASSSSESSDDECTVPCKKIKISQYSFPHQLHPPPAQPLADNNKDYKSLDICCSSPLLHDWLASIPNLQLKELRSSTPKLFPDNLSFVSRISSDCYEEIIRDL